jgi:hypothetical protein
VGLLTSLTTTPVGAEVKEDKSSTAVSVPRRRTDAILRRGTGSSGQQCSSTIDKDEVAGVERKEEGWRRQRRCRCGWQQQQQQLAAATRMKRWGVERRLDGFSSANVLSVLTPQPACRMHLGGSRPALPATYIRLAAAENITIDAGGCKGKPY